MDSFGERLKREREKRGVTLDDVSAATKISTRMLRALEEQKFDQLPGGIFNKGFVRAYAQQLGIDEELAVADYLTTVGENQPDKRLDLAPQALPLEPRDERPPSDTAASIPWGWLAVALLIVAIAFALWSLLSRKPSVGSSAAPPAVHAARGDALQKAKAEPASPPSTSIEPSPKAVPHAASPTPAAVDGQSAAVAVPGSFTLRIQAREDSWISISADGQQIVEDTLVAPAEKSASAQKEIVVKAGNVGALAFNFNGKELPAQGDFGEVKTLVFHSNGLQPPPPAVANP